MIKSVIALTCAALLTGAVQAQVSGSINRNAAKVTNTISMGGNEMSITYTALRFGKGQWQKVKDDAASHEGFNKMAEARPVGSVKTSVDVTAAGRTIPAGEYSMFFTVNEQAGWILNLKPAEGDMIRWRMHLSETDDKSECLKVSLEPAAKDNTCSISISFGDMQVTVPVMIGAKKE